MSVGLEFRSKKNGLISEISERDERVVLWSVLVVSLLLFFSLSDF
jgi:hypothetical protein